MNNNYHSSNQIFKLISMSNLNRAYNHVKKSRQKESANSDMMHQVMYRLKFKLANDKTFIGKISCGFGFLGYRFNQHGLIGLANKTIDNFKEHIVKLYEQGTGHIRISQYVRRWFAWATAGL